LIKAPFPYFGGKSRVSDIVWERFGNVRNYVEPFCGSAAVLLARPEPWEGVETINDLDGYVANFWRAMSREPEEVAAHADWPVNEIDLMARHHWLANFRDEFSARMKRDPDIYDVKVAGWWLYGMCSWIGYGFAVNPERTQIPHLSAGMGINRKLPHLGDAGRGINRKLPHLGDAGRGNQAWAHLEEVAVRIRNVRVACGSWDRVLGDSVTWRHGLTGILFDPPYPEGTYSYGEGADREVAHEVRDWCKANGDNPLLRLALCGYDEHNDLAELGWTPHNWKTGGGYGNQSDGAGRENSAREVVWFSPHCLSEQQARLF
jgi:site-specific DNA-adenine methylase